MIDITGRITLGDPCESLRQTVDQALTEGCTGVILNLAGVEYMDSAGIGQLIGAARSAKTRGSSLKLLNVTRRVQDLLRLTGVMEIFECFGDETTALASFDIHP